MLPTATLPHAPQPQPTPQMQPDPNTAPTPTGSQPNFFEKLLPTAGSILGGLITAPFELAPGLGTALNIGGAAAGGALGKFLENKLTGQAGGNDVLSSGLEGAVGQGSGALLGGLLKGGMGLLGRAADTGATKLVQGQFAKGALTSEDAAALNNMGITNADQVGQIAPHITQANGALSQGVRRGLGESGMGVDVTGLDQIAKNSLAEQGASPRAIDTVGQNLTNATNNMVPGSVTQIAQKGGGSTFSYEPGALQNAVPDYVFNQTQKMQSLAAEAANKAFDKSGAVINSDEYAKYKAYQALGNELQNRTFGGDNPIPLSEENKAQILQDLLPIKDINPQAYNYHVQQVTNAQNLQDLRPIQAPIVRASQALNATNNAASRAGGLSATDVVKMAAPLVGNTAAGLPGMAGGLALSALGTKAADKIGATTLSKVSDLLTNPTMQKIVKEGTSVPTQVVANAPNYVDNNQNPGGNIGMAPGTSPEVNPYMTTGGGVGLSPMTLALQTGLLGLQDPYLASSYAPLIQSTIPAIQKATAAQAALRGLEGTFQQAGGGQGLFGGLLSRLGGALTGGPAQLYSQQAADLGKQLNALGVPITSLPQLTNTTPAAQSGFGTIQDIINSLGGGGSVLAGLPT